MSDSINAQQLLEVVLSYVDLSTGLSSSLRSDGSIRITQDLDGKQFQFSLENLTEVLERNDSDNKPFLQVNFKSGLKVLFTDSLVGFKPSEVQGLPMSRIPKVVTTPDLMSVLEAIEEGLSAEETPDREVETLKKVFQAILTGGEKVGFDLSFERKWIERLLSTRLKASA